MKGFNNMINSGTLMVHFYQSAQQNNKDGLYPRLQKRYKVQSCRVAWRCPDWSPSMCLGFIADTLQQCRRCPRPNGSRENNIRIRLESHSYDWPDTQQRATGSAPWRTSATPSAFTVQELRRTRGGVGAERMTGERHANKFSEPASLVHSPTSHSDSEVIRHRHRHTLGSTRSHDKQERDRIRWGAFKVRARQHYRPTDGVGNESMATSQVTRDTLLPPALPPTTSTYEEICVR